MLLIVSVIFSIAELFPRVNKILLHYSVIVFRYSFNSPVPILLLHSIVNTLSGANIMKHSLVAAPYSWDLYYVHYYYTVLAVNKFAYPVRRYGIIP